MQKQSTNATQNEELFWKQKELLDTLLERKAIDRRQYDKSLGCLREKMRITGAE